MNTLGRLSFRRKIACASVAAAGIGFGGFLSASDECAPHIHIDWENYGAFRSYDAATLRRGYQVYRQVCATCHSLKSVYFRHLIGVTHTEEEAKAIAATFEIQDGPKEDGSMYMRPREIKDRFPSPYANDEEGRLANNGALPPDLSLMAGARVGGGDYIFCLLTGYGCSLEEPDLNEAPTTKCTPPKGKKLFKGLYYNSYFPTGGIAMPPPITEDGQVEYEDGTKATVTQMAKDVSMFLSWASEPELDERKYEGVKMMIFFAMTFPFVWYGKRKIWSIFKTRKVSMINVRDEKLGYWLKLQKMRKDATNRSKFDAK